MAQYLVKFGTVTFGWPYALEMTFTVLCPHEIPDCSTFVVQAQYFVVWSSDFSLLGAVLGRCVTFRSSD